MKRFYDTVKMFLIIEFILYFFIWIILWSNKLHTWEIISNSTFYVITIIIASFITVDAYTKENQ